MFAPSGYYPALRGPRCMLQILDITFPSFLLVGYLILLKIRLKIIDSGIG